MIENDKNIVSFYDEERFLAPLNPAVCSVMADVCAQLSRISLTLRNGRADEETGSDVITLNRDSPDSAHTAV